VILGLRQKTNVISYNASLYLLSALPIDVFQPSLTRLGQYLGSDVVSDLYDADAFCALTGITTDALV